MCSDYFETCLMLGILPFFATVWNMVKETITIFSGQILVHTLTNNFCSTSKCWKYIYTFHNANENPRYFNDLGGQFLGHNICDWSCPRENPWSVITLEIEGSSRLWKEQWHRPGSLIQLQYKLLPCANHFTSLYINFLIGKLKILNCIVSQSKLLPLFEKVIFFIFLTDKLKGKKPIRDWSEDWKRRMY